MTTDRIITNWLNTISLEELIDELINDAYEYGYHAAYGMPSKEEYKLYTKMDKQEILKRFQKTQPE